MPTSAPDGHELADSVELAEACVTGLNPRQDVRAVTVLARASPDDERAEGLL